MTNAEGSTARAFLRSTWSKKLSIFVGAKSETCSLTRCAMAVARRALCFAWFPVRSFFLYVREKSEEGDLFWIYALDSERVFAVCVLCSLPAEGGLTGFWFKLLMNDGRLGFPVSSTCSCRTRTARRSQDGTTVSSEWDEGVRASAITFLMRLIMPGRVFRRWVYENLKYANSV